MEWLDKLYEKTRKAVSKRKEVQIDHESNSEVSGK